jgi:hypothetical protein
MQFPIKEVENNKNKDRYINAWNKAFNSQSLTSHEYYIPSLFALGYILGKSSNNNQNIYDNMEQLSNDLYESHVIDEFIDKIKFCTNTSSFTKEQRITNDMSKNYKLMIHNNNCALNYKANIYLEKLSESKLSFEEMNKISKFISIVKKSAIKTLEEMDYIKNLQSILHENEEMFCIDKYNYPRKHIYTNDNHLKTFISMDLTKANWTTLTQYLPKLFKLECNLNSWTEFIEQIIDKQKMDCSTIVKEMIINSKNIRQYVLGKLNIGLPIQMIFTHLMCKLNTILAPLVDSIKLKFLSTDEIVYVCNGDKVDISNILDKVFEEHSNELLIDRKSIRVMTYKLYNLNNMGYVRLVYENGSICKSKCDFKHVHVEKREQCYKLFDALCES